MIEARPIKEAAESQEDYYLSSQWRLMGRKLRRHKLAMIGGAMLLFFYALVVFAEVLAPYNTTSRHDQVYAPPQRVRIFDRGRLRAPFVHGYQVKEDPVTWRKVYSVDRERRYRLRLFVSADDYRLWGSWRGTFHLLGVEDGGTLFLFGTDALGRDLFSRIIYAARISLTVGLVGVFLSFALGCVLGGLSGFYGGAIDTIIQRVIEFLMALPSIPVWMALSAALPPEWSPIQVYFGITLVLSVKGWCGLGRVVQRQDPGAAGGRLRHGGPCRRDFHRQDHPHPSSSGISELPRRPPHPEHSADDSRRDGPELSGPRHPSAGRELGDAPAGCAERPHGLAAPVAAHPSPGRDRGRAQLQSLRRWPAGRGRSVQVVGSRWRMSAREAGALLRVEGLKVVFQTDEGLVEAVNGVSLELGRNRILGVIGESGCGKSVTARSILRIVPHPGREVAGTILFDSAALGRVDLLELDPKGSQIRQVRGREISMVFQEPMTSLSPVHTVGFQITEAINLHVERNAQAARELAVEMLAKVGIPQPGERFDYYPHQLSGGLRQRVMIAMALSCNPSLLIADEPTTALDVTVQAQILELLRDLQGRMGMSVLYITHNLGVICELADDVCVMYLGRVVERGSLEEVFVRAGHPYTRQLLKSIPRPEGGQERLQAIRGNVPTPINMGHRCGFFERCDHAMPGKCDRAVPALVDRTSGHGVRCFLHGDEAEPGES